MERNPLRGGAHMVQKWNLDVGDIVFDQPLCFEDIVKEPLGEGSYGITYKVRFRDAAEMDTPASPAVLKILKPTPALTSGVDPAKDFAEEISFLRQLRHPGVVRVLKKGRCTVPNQQGITIKTSYYVTEFEDGVVPLAEVVSNPIDAAGKPFRIEFLISLMQCVLQPLAHCHERSVLHLDLHPSNILIKQSESRDSHTLCSLAVLIDFGKAKSILENELTEGEVSPYVTIGGGLYEFKHPALRPYLRRNRASRQLFKEPESIRFDLYSISTCFRKVFDQLPAVEKTTNAGRLVRQIIVALRNDGDTVEYGIAEALRTLQRAADPSQNQSMVLLRLSGEINARIEKQFFQIIDTPEFQRLRKVYQLCFTHLVYPSATHSRFSHSLGAFNLCGMYLENLFRSRPTSALHTISPTSIWLGSQF